MLSNTRIISSPEDVFEGEVVWARLTPSTRSYGDVVSAPRLIVNPHEPRVLIPNLPDGSEGWYRQ